ILPEMLPALGAIVRFGAAVGLVGGALDQLARGLVEHQARRPEVIAKLEEDVERLAANRWDIAGGFVGEAREAHAVREQVGDLRFGIERVILGRGVPDRTAELQAIEDVERVALFALGVDGALADAHVAGVVGVVELDIRDADGIGGAGDVEARGVPALGGDEAAHFVPLVAEDLAAFSAGNAGAVAVDSELRQVAGDVVGGPEIALSSTAAAPVACTFELVGLTPQGSVFDVPQAAVVEALRVVVGLG